MYNGCQHLHLSVQISLLLYDQSVHSVDVLHPVLPKPHQVPPTTKHSTYQNKKHLKNVGPIRHNEPPRAHSADVASCTVACRLRINVHDIDIDNNDNDDNDNA